MGLVEKQKNSKHQKGPNFDNPIELSIEEVNFIMEKLQSSQYVGYEFEQFFKVWKKLDNYRKSG